MRRTAVILLIACGLVAITITGRATDPGGHLNITQVFVDDPDDPTSLMIIGEDFLFSGESPAVTLGDFGDLTVIGSPTFRSSRSR